MPTDCQQVLFVPSQPAQFVTFNTYSATAIVAGIATVTPGAMSGTISDANWIIQAGTIVGIIDGANTEYVTVTGTTNTTFTATFLYSHPNPYSIVGQVPTNYNSNSINPTIPQLGGINSIPFRNELVPRPFTIASDIVTAEWGSSFFGDVQYGLGAPATVILTDVRAAQLVYTGDIPAPDEWDSLFQECFCAALASRMAMAVIEDKKLAMAMMGQQVAIAKAALTEARLVNGNEGVTHLNRDASWTRARYVWDGCAGWDNNQSGGCGWQPYGSFGFADGSTI